MNNKSYLKYLNRILIVIFSVIALLLSINSSEDLEFSEFHKDNFVNLRISSTYYSCNQTETGMYLDYDENNCISEGVIFEATASGLSVKSVDGLTYTLTAAHFCNVFRNSSDSSGYFSSDLWVTDQTGMNYFGQIVHMDTQSDLCLVSSGMPIDENVSLAKDVPDIGEKIYAISSPLNISEDGILLHFEGFFSGCNSDRVCFFTIPATSGSSGSIVFNSSGDAIGMIQMVPVGFNSVSLGIGRHSISTFLQESSDKTGVDISI
tara:strand:+ start:2919 stop:3707 length:789 start_codon:yes stop_codon:yes gene_type:complete